jgi:hypothetical protein
MISVLAAEGCWCPTSEEKVMDDHPQVKAFMESTAILRADRYWDFNSKEEQIRLLCALKDVLTEVCFHLDVHKVLPQAVLAMWQTLAAPGIQRLPVRPSSGLVLMSYLDLRVEQLIAESNDSGNTGAEGTHVP